MLHDYVLDSHLYFVYIIMCSQQPDLIVLSQVNLPFQYGTHHTKMMLLQYTNGLRIVIHTANLVPDDWEEKTQGYWVSPLFPELGNFSYLNFV